MNEIVRNIDTCLRVREAGAKALLETIRIAKTKRLSEKELANMWLEKTISDPTLCNRGWYEPPPNGFSVLVHDEAHPDRLDFPSLRVLELWSRSDIFWDTAEAAFFYCSPVDKKSEIIGDFSVTLYNGDDQKIRNHFRLCYSIVSQVAKFAQIGMKFSEVYDFAAALIEENHLRNTTLSVTDSMDLDIGHTIPWTYEAMTKEENDIQENGSWAEQKSMISNKRKFVNRAESLVISENMVFTVEQRMKSTLDTTIPTPTFHLLVVFREGKKAVVDNFGELFKEWSMDYLEET